MGIEMKSYQSVDMAFNHWATAVITAQVKINIFRACALLNWAFTSIVFFQYCLISKL